VTEVDEMLKAMGPGCFVLIATEKAPPWLLRINDNDAVWLDAYDETIKLELPGLYDFVTALDALRMDGDIDGLQQYRVDN
jgi:hypothetical protein